MKNNTLTQHFVDTKRADYHNFATNLPSNGGLFGKQLASTLGVSAARLLGVYESMFSMIGNGKKPDVVKNAVNRQLEKKSKIHFGDSNKNTARICGLYAMVHSGVVDAEVDMYARIVDDVSSFDISGDASIADVVENVARADPESYRSLLSKRVTAVDDYAVLMGVKKDKSHLEKLTSDMPGHLADYYRKTVRNHKGILGVSIPFSFARFSNSIDDSLRYDTISSVVQRGAGCDIGFKEPVESPLSQFTDEIRNGLNYIKDKNISLSKRVRAAVALPVSAFYLSGLDAYAGNGGAHYESGIPLESHAFTQYTGISSAGGLMSGVSLVFSHDEIQHSINYSFDGD